MQTIQNPVLVKSQLEIQQLREPRDDDNRWPDDKEPDWFYFSSGHTDTADVREMALRVVAEHPEAKLRLLRRTTHETVVTDPDMEDWSHGVRPASERGIPLRMSPGPHSPGSYITVEDYEKWYNLYLVTVKENTDRVARDINRSEEWTVEVLYLDEIGAEFYERTGEVDVVDHVFNPRFLLFLADRQGWVLQPCVHETAVGRWLLETKDYPTDWKDSYAP